MVEIRGGNLVEGIGIRDLRTGGQSDLQVGGVFVEIGRMPTSQLARGIARVNGFGEIEVNRNCETGVPGLFAAGDVTDVPDKQMVIAAAEGAKAALQAQRYIRGL